MNGNIQVSYDDKISGYVVRMPEFVSLRAIEEWRKNFSFEFKSLPSSQRVIVLIDTNRHEFESIQCLKSLRDFFTTNAEIKSNGVKTAFVQPGNIMDPHIKSDIEGYFENYDEAYKWLKE